MSKPSSLLVTGGAGFIGSHLCQALLRRGHALSIVDDLNSFYDPQWKRANLDEVRRTAGFDFHQADICDFDALRHAFERVRPAAVIHLAARAGVRPSLEQPRLYQQVNVGGTVNLLELCREFGVRNFIFGSSSSVYGERGRGPFTEESAGVKPLSPYAATKMAGEMMCYTYARLFSITSVCLRFFTVYGPRQRPDLAIHKFVHLLESGSPLPVFGDGSTGRDYTFVDDIVAGVLAALDFAAQQSAGAFEVFNLGNSSPVSLNELIAAIEQATGRSARRDQLPAQPGDVPFTWADVSKAGRMLGYQPSTPLVEGLNRFVAWYREVAAERYGAAGVPR